MTGTGTRIGLALCAGLLYLLGLAGPAAAATQSASPSLRFANTSQSGLVVAGAGWRPRSTVIFWVTAGTMNRGLELTARKDGTFAVGVQGLDMCARPTFRARDLAQGRARLDGPPLACAQPLTVPPPQLRILAGKAAQPATVRIYNNSPNTVTMRLGDELYVWEPATAGAQAQPSIAAVAAFTPHADARYLVAVQEGVTPPRACPQPDCSAGFFWLYVAVRAGKTALIISPACRQSTPPCMAPDFLTPVNIERPAPSSA